jgi:hypothetical protein
MYVFMSIRNRNTERTKGATGTSRGEPVSPLLAQHCPRADLTFSKSTQPLHGTNQYTRPLILETNTLLTKTEANKQSKQHPSHACRSNWSSRSNIPKVGQFAHQISHHETANRAFNVSTSALDARCMSLCLSATETLKEQKVRLVPLEKSPFISHHHVPLFPFAYPALLHMTHFDYILCCDTSLSIRATGVC